MFFQFADLKTELHKYLRLVTPPSAQIPCRC
jgi:hypothetical protein